MASPFLGEIRLGAWNFAPRGWMLCNGQILAISTNTALFSLLGTTYGGNGISTFALPDLRGRVPVGMGTGPGLSQMDLGQVLGTEMVTLNSTQMPAHVHTLPASSGTATTNRPAGAYVAVGNSYNLTRNATMGWTDIAGSNLPHDNMQPSLGLTFVIAVEGIFPSRN